MKTPWVEGVQYLEPLYKSLAEETGAHDRAPPPSLSSHRRVKFSKNPSSVHLAYSLNGISFSVATADFSDLMKAAVKLCYCALCWTALGAGATSTCHRVGTVPGTETHWVNGGQS